MRPSGEDVMRSRHLTSGGEAARLVLGLLRIHASKKLKFIFALCIINPSVPSCAFRPVS